MAKDISSGPVLTRVYMAMNVETLHESELLNFGVASCFEVGFHSLYSSVWPDTHDVDQVGLELAEILLLLSECWDGK